MYFREATQNDCHAICQLYKEVSRIEGGIARSEDEITEEYVGHFIAESVRSGLIIVAQHPEIESEVVAEIHAYKNGLSCFGHVLGNLTIVVHPKYQGRRIGRTIMTIFLDEISKHRPDVGKVELITRESNARAIALYQSLGFRIEGRMEMRIRTVERHYEADIPMGWQNPNFEF